jgi:hypothetical protein
MKEGKYEAEIVRVYEAIGHTGNDDRDHRTYTIGFFTTATLATEAARGKGFYTGDGQVKAVKVLRIVNSFYMLEPVQVDDMTHQERRRKAIAKLTPEDLEALGIEEGAE